MIKFRIALLIAVMLTISACGSVNNGTVVTDTKIKSVEAYRKTANEACERASFSSALKEIPEDSYTTLKDALTEQKAPKELKTIHDKLVTDLKSADNKSAIAIVTKFAEQLHLDKCLRSSDVNIPVTPTSDPNSTPSSSTPSSGGGGGGGGGGNNPPPNGGGIDDETPTVINGFTVTKDRAVWRSYFNKINSSCASLKSAKEAVLQDITTLAGGAVVNGSSLAVIYQDVNDMKYALDDLGFAIDTAYGQSPPDTFEIRQSDATKAIKSASKLIEANATIIGTETFDTSPDAAKISATANQTVTDLLTLTPVFANLGMANCP